MVLDNEAVQALLDPTHRKHRTVLAYLEVRNQRQRGRRVNHRVLVPVGVRIEAGWDRTAATAADINRISAAVDVDLRRAGADRAVQLRQTADVSVVDATVGQTAESAQHPAVILTSDIDDMTRLAATLEGTVRVIGI
ncbi:MAG: hypothetical protein ACR2MA_11525 [Egibacteraceae bacterium]